jgi:hypothetical protein
LTIAYQKTLKLLNLLIKLKWHDDCNSLRTNINTAEERQKTYGVSAARCGTDAKGSEAGTIEYEEASNDVQKENHPDRQRQQPG